jgi:hypothetical protein
MQPAQIYELCRELCQLLAYIHSQTPPVIHRDIKPQNIIMRRDGSLGLTDFGIARIFKEGSDSDTQNVGTFPYAPPEQYGYAQSSAQTDIYALGILLIYLATGSPDRQNLAERIKDPQFRALIERCIAFDPKDRFQSVEQVVKRIDSMGTRPRRLTMMIAAGAVAAALVGVGIWGLVALLTPDGSDGRAGKQIEEPVEEPVESQADPTGAEATDGADPTASSTSEDLGGGLFDSSQTGNLPGNLVNGGLAVEGAGAIYVATDDAIYELGLDGTPRGRILDATKPMSLNYWQDKLYYASAKDGLVSYDPRTRQSNPLVELPVTSLFIDRGKLYFELSVDGRTELYTIGADGSGIRRLEQKGEVFPALVYVGYYFFSDREDDDKLYRTDLASGETKSVYDLSVFWFTVSGDRLYFSDMPEEGSSVLMTAGLDGSDPERVTRGAASFVVAAPGGLYYANTMDEVVVLPLEGGAEKVLTDHESFGIFLAGDWVFYTNEEDDSNLWMVRADGTDDHAFEPPS